MISAAAVVLIGAFVLDVLVREWPGRIHPVAWFGRIVGAIDRDWAWPRFVGIAAAISLPVAAALIATGVVSAAFRVGSIAGMVVGGMALFSTFSLRMLLEVARDVDEAASTSLSVAREAVQALVGRDVSAMNVTGLRSATIESLAENLSDGFVAPLIAFALGAQVSVTVGVGLAVWVKAVNTMDSMLGYHHVSTGWASARLDDLVMAVPARLTAVLIAAATIRPTAIRAAGADARVPASPNAGWPMATMARVLDVRLEKPDHYVLNDRGRSPDDQSVTRAIRTTGIAGVLAVGLAGVAVW